MQSSRPGWNWRRLDCFFFLFFFFFRLSISRKSQRGFEKLSREQTLSADRKTEKNKGRFSYFFRQSSRGVIPACLTAKRPGYSRAGAFLRSRGAWGTNAGSKREKAAGVILRLVFRRSTLLAKRRRCFFFFFPLSLNLDRLISPPPPPKHSPQGPVPAPARPPLRGQEAHPAGVPHRQSLRVSKQKSK